MHSSLVIQREARELRCRRDRRFLCARDALTAIYNAIIRNVEGMRHDWIGEFSSASEPMRRESLRMHE